MKWLLYKRTTFLIIILFLILFLILFCLKVAHIQSGFPTSGVSLIFPEIFYEIVGHLLNLFWSLPFIWLLFEFKHSNPYLWISGLVCLVAVIVSIFGGLSVIIAMFALFAFMFSFFIFPIYYMGMIFWLSRLNTDKSAVDESSNN